MKVMLDDGAFKPTRAHETDAGLDLYAMHSGVIDGGESLSFETGVHVEIPHGYCGLLVSKSGMNVRYDITSTGLIDEGYTGGIIVKLYNHGSRSYQVLRGDKISQLVLIPILYEDVEIVDSLEETDRGANGFGSSGK